MHNNILLHFKLVTGSKPEHCEPDKDVVIQRSSLSGPVLAAPSLKAVYLVQQLAMIHIISIGVLWAMFAATVTRLSACVWRIV